MCEAEGYRWCSNAITNHTTSNSSSTINTGSNLTYKHLKAWKRFEMNSLFERFYEYFQWITLILNRWYFNGACLAFWGFNINIDINIKTHCCPANIGISFRKCVMSLTERVTLMCLLESSVTAVFICRAGEAAVTFTRWCAAVFLSDPERPHNPNDRETAEDEKRATDRERPWRVNYAQTVSISLSTLSPSFSHMLFLSFLCQLRVSQKRE